MRIGKRWVLVHVMSEARRLFIGMALFRGMIELRMSSLGAFTDTARRMRPNPGSDTSCDSFRMPSIRPTVETLILDGAMDGPRWSTRRSSSW